MYSQCKCTLLTRNKRWLLYNITHANQCMCTHVRGNLK